MKALRYSITSRHLFINGEPIFKPSLIVELSYRNQNHNYLNCQYLRIISIYLIEKCKEGIKIIIREDESKKHIRTGLSSTYP